MPPSLPTHTGEQRYVGQVSSQPARPCGSNIIHMQVQRHPGIPGFGCKNCTQPSPPYTSSSRHPMRGGRPERKHLAQTHSPPQQSPSWGAKQELTDPSQKQAPEWREHFRDPTQIETAEQQIFQLHQGNNSVRAYVEDFKIIAADLD
ncbi:hypothetical protein L345_10156, partial [Ophiophagus hannah]